MGRELDLALLRRTFDRTVASASPQLVTVVGEPGLGKSRIVAELFRYADARPELVTWRQGRCLPYGERSSFWALGEVIKAHAGILESDDSATATAKLDLVLPAGEERPWFRQRVVPLLGVEATSTAERPELFTAWRRLLEHVGGAGPTVIVFEDLHWADDAMLAFIEHVAARAEPVPLLILGTARPELVDRWPDLAKGLPHSMRVDLAPLSDAETARLVSAILGATEMPAELQRPILERVGGNPLYAEEFVRLLRDRDLIVRDGGTWELRDGVQMPLPDSVHALIAARLDTLTGEAKSLLADASVVGKVFWSGAVRSMSGREPDQVREALQELCRKDLVRPSRQSTMAGEEEYSFWHAFTRDVAYGQLPRNARAARHVAAARWIESSALERIEDVADVLAHHYVTALGLSKTYGSPEPSGEVAGCALRFLSLAGERALGLNTSAALAHLRDALVLAPEGHPERPGTLARYGEAALQAGRYREAAESLDEAIVLFRSTNQIPLAARAMGILSIALSRLGDPRQWTLPAEALEILEPLGPSAALVAALTEVARAEALAARSERSLALTDRAMGLAEALGLPPQARVLGYRAMARLDLGDSGGLADFREAIALATQAGLGDEVGLLYNNLGTRLWLFEGPAASLDVLREGTAFAAPRGLTVVLDAVAESSLGGLFDTGEHMEALALVAEMEPRLQAHADTWDLLGIRVWKARILALRGDQGANATEWLDWIESSARATEDPLFVVEGLATVALVRAGLGQVEAPTRLLCEVDAHPGVRINPHYPTVLNDMVRTALRIGEGDLAARLVSGYEPRSPYGRHALMAANAALDEYRHNHQAALTGYRGAARHWSDFGVVPETAHALLGHARCLMALGRADQAARTLHRARAAFRPLEAAPALSEIDDLVDRATDPGL